MHEDRPVHDISDLQMLCIEYTALCGVVFAVVRSWSVALSCRVVECPLSHPVRVGCKTQKRSVSRRITRVTQPNCEERAHARPLGLARAAARRPSSIFALKMTLAFCLCFSSHTLHTHSQAHLTFEGVGTATPTLYATPPSLTTHPPLRGPCRASCAACH